MKADELWDKHASDTDGVRFLMRQDDFLAALKEYGEHVKAEKKLAAIRSAGMPVEPVALTAYALKEKGRARNGAEWQESAEAIVEVTKQVANPMSENIKGWKERAEKAEQDARDSALETLGYLRDKEKAESELAALRGRLMEPDEEMRKFARTLLSMSTVKTEADAVMLFKAMAAVALKERK